MQNRTTIKGILLVLSLICLYELSFTYFAKVVESEVEEEAAGDPVVYSNLLKEKENEEVWLGYTYMDCKKREINLGLDLRGGVSVTLEISMEELVASMVGENANSPEFKAVAERAEALETSEQRPYVELFYQAFKEVGPKQAFSAWFINIDNEFTAESTDEEVLEQLMTYSEEAINQANEVLRSRVKQFGIAQPDIRKLGASGRIVVDLPGVKDLKRIRGLLQGSANLEFWDVYSWRDLSSEAALLADAYDLMYNKEKKDSLDGDSIAADSANIPQLDNPFRAILYAGYTYYMTVPLKDTARVNQFLSNPRTQKMVPRNGKFAWSSQVNKSDDAIEESMTLFLLRSNRYGKALMEGDIIKYARADFDGRTGQKIVSLDFNASQVNAWEEITRKSYEEQKPIAIVLDNIVFSAPTAHDGPISSGTTQISGGSDGNANWNADLANVLNAGKFPAPARIVEESFVGPSLGKASIQAGFVSFIVALLVVLIYMVFYYNTAGWVANAALLANIFIIIGALGAFPTISLTLPGLAGIVLTVGMSVDANVLIYERIREELRSGKGIKNAIADGYKNSYTAILDANITTLITGFILWYFGTGVIESFAQTLVIGLFTSLFSAIFITRLIFSTLLDKDKKIEFGNTFTNNLLLDKSFKFVQNKNKFYIASGLVILIGLGSIFTKGFNLGTDFSGGRTYKVQFDHNVNEEEVREALASAFVNEAGERAGAEVKTYGDNSKIAITTKFLYEDKSKDASQKVEKALYEGLKGFYAADMTFEKFTSQEDAKEVGLMQSYMVGPSIADDIIDSAFTSIIIALIAIFAYVAIRFRKWELGVGALVAIFHDVLIVLALFSIFYGILPFSMEINQAFIAAILTVVGYSINDTVVVFDRIRETLPTRKVKPLSEVVNEALNSTLSRTFNTSITIIVVLLAILFWGGESIQGFAFALLVGVVVGTYSSLCIAAPVYVDLEKDKE